MTRTALSFLVDRKSTCPHVERQAERAGPALAQAEELCRARRVRLTAIRREVLETLYATHKPLGAYEIAERLGTSGRRLAPITVYRALDFLTEQGLAHRLASQNAYIGSFHRDSAPDTVAFLICEACGGVDEASAADLSETVAALLSREGFAPRTKLLEIVGCCAHCR